MSEETKPFKTNTFYHIANEYRKNITDENEIEKNDMTKTLEQEEETMIKNGEIIIMNINAKMRLGKSTLALARAQRIHQLLKKYKKRPTNEQFGMNNIARDDQEFSKMMRNPDLNNNIIVTDESNELEQIGENVTAENALKKVFSDVQAGRYVHRICCSPKETVDQNADIMLSIIATDKKNGITRSKLYYRYYEGGSEYTQLLGYVDTNVSKIIQTWRTIEPTFLKQNKTKNEIELIKKTAQNDWYTQYMIKKYEKMELITKEGIFQPRKLDYAEVILQTIEQLKPLTKIPNIVTPGLIKSAVSTNLTKKKLPATSFGIAWLREDIIGTLELWKSFYKLSRDILKAKKGEIDDLQEANIEELEKQRQILLNTAKQQEEELNRYIIINQKYHQKNQEETQ